jgi:hypothetical protein
MRDRNGSLPFSIAPLAALCNQIFADCIHINRRDDQLARRRGRQKEFSRNVQSGAKTFPNR